MKKINLILIIFIIIISLLLGFFYLKNNTKIQDNNIISILGKIESKKITLDDQYLYVIDDKNNKWKIIISENTIFKQMLELKEGDSINIKGEKDNYDIKAIEIKQ